MDERTFIVLPISSKEGKELQPIRVPVGDIKDYRKWLNKDETEQTVFYFTKQSRRKKLIANMPVNEVDQMFNVVKSTSNE